LLLCHEKPEHLIKLLSMQFFHHKNAKIYVHYDASRPQSSFELLKEFANNHSNIQLLENRVICKWGEFSLVDASVKMMEACIEDESFNADYFYLFSGSCAPIKSFASLQNLLTQNYGTEFIEATDISRKKWVVDGLQEERYQYDFPYNFKDERKKFDQYFEQQKKAGVKRKAPETFKAHFGSQWFCITDKAATYVVEQMKDPEIFDFFKRSWIPDEFAIQSLVYNVSGTGSIANKSLTYFQFNSFGKPLVFYGDHFQYLEGLPFVFARKISNQANELYKKLDAYTSDHKVAKINVFDAKPVMVYEYFKQRNTVDHLGGKIGRIKDWWKDGIDKNEKEYFVLTGACKHFIKLLVNQACLDEKHVVFSFLFNNDKVTPSVHFEPYNGFSKKDKTKRDYDNTAYLYQVIHSSKKPICFALDPCDDHENIRDVIRWDKNATVMMVKPDWESKYHKAVGFLTEAQAMEILTLQAPPEHILELVNKQMWIKNKNFWIDVNDSGEHKAKLELKNKLQNNIFLPQANLEILKILKANKFEKELHV